VMFPFKNSCDSQLSIITTNIFDSF
jgi:hypothetical protein